MAPRIPNRAITPPTAPPIMADFGVELELELEMEMKVDDGTDPSGLVGNDLSLLLLSAATAAKGRVSVSLE